jgi:hypothetical protein
MTYADCVVCGPLPSAAFYMRRNGKRSSRHCIVCDREAAKLRMRRHKAAHPQKHRDKWKRQDEARRHTPKVLAREAVRAAVKSGRLGKPAQCEGCASVVSLHGHHRDYSRPLDVEWLCVPCHAAAHRKLGWR